MFVRLDISEEDKKFIVFRKFVSNNPMSDFLPDKEKVWKQTSVGMPPALLELSRRNPSFNHRLFRENPDGSTKTIGEDDGMILKYEGRYAGERYIDRGRIIPDEEADMMMEAGTKLVTFAMWEFRLESVIATDGPKLRERLMETGEQKAAHEREGMFTAVRDAFAALIPQAVPLTVEEAEEGERAVKETSVALTNKMREALKESKGE
jgi:hypothetical protein